MLHGSGQAEARHIGIDALKLAGTDAIGLMPNPDRTIAPDEPIELRPGRIMRAIAGVSIGVKVIEALPILRESAAAPVDKILDTQKAKRGITA